MPEANSDKNSERTIRALLDAPVKRVPTSVDTQSLICTLSYSAPRTGSSRKVLFTEIPHGFTCYPESLLAPKCPILLLNEIAFEDRIKLYHYSIETGVVTLHINEGGAADPNLLKRARKQTQLLRRFQALLASYRPDEAPADWLRLLSIFDGWSTAEANLGEVLERLNLAGIDDLRLSDLAIDFAQIEQRDPKALLSLFESLIRISSGKLRSPGDLKKNKPILNALQFITSRQIEENPANETLRYQRARLLMMLDDTSNQSIESLKQIVSAKPDRLANLHLLWLCWYYDRPTQAQVIADHLTSSKEPSPEFAHLLWNLYVLLEKAEQALQAYKFALRAAPNFYKEIAEPSFCYHYPLLLAAYKLDQLDNIEDIKRRVAQQHPHLTMQEGSIERVSKNKTPNSEIDIDRVFKVSK